MGPSSELLNSNIALIESRHFCPGIKDVATDEMIFAPPAEIFESANGLLSMRCKDDGGDFLIHSRFDPEREANAIVETAALDDKINVVIVVGFGCGHVIKALLEKVGDKVKIVVVEPDIATLTWYLLNQDASEILSDDRVNLIGIDDPIQASSAVMTHLQLLTLRGWVPLITPPMVRKFSTFLKEFTRSLDELTSSQKLGFATHADTSELFMSNSFLNAEFVASSPGVLQLRGCWKGRPAILVSAGPSLEKQLPLLSEIKDKFLIVSVGAALRSLLNAGIEPHIVVTVDPFPVMYDHFKGLKSNGSWLLSDTAGNHNIVKNYSDKRLFGHSTPQMEELFKYLSGPRGLMMSGGSVANSAFSAVAIMQADPIIMIGQDLAFTGGVSHAVGNVKRYEVTEDMVKSEPQKYKKIPGYYGDEVVTEVKMNSYRIWFERVIPTITMSRVINSTEGGALIEGAENIPFAEIVESVMPEHEVDFDDVVLDLPNFERVSLIEFRTRVLKVRRQVLAMQKISEKTAELAKQILSIQSKDDHEIELLDRIKIKYNRSLKQMRRLKGAGDLFVTGFVQKGILFLQRRQALFHEDEKDETFTNYTYQLTLVNACKQADKLLKRFLAKTLN